MKRRMTALIALALATLSLVVHAPLIRHGLRFLHSDFAPQLLIVERLKTAILSGAGVQEWPVFPFGMDYSGLTLTYLRLFWALLLSIFSGTRETFIQGQVFFTYGITPVLWTLAIFYLVSRYASLGAAIFSGVMAALGSAFWMSQYGNDAYFGYLILGSLLLGWRAGFENPWTELSVRKLWLAAALTGLSLYTSRASLVFVVAFWVPWPLFFRELKLRLKPQDRWERVILGLIWGLLGFYFYLELFGASLGQVRGKEIRVHAAPNLQYAVILALALELKARFKELRSGRWLRPALLFGFGWVCGFAPELFWCFRNGRLPTTGAWENYGIPEMFRNLGLIPGSLRETWVSGYPLTMAPTQIATLLLVLAGLWSLGRHLRRDVRLQALGVAALLAIYAYIRTRTYTEPNARYLLPLAPAFLVGLGLFWDDLKRRGRLASVLGLLLLTIHGTAQWIAERREVSRVVDSRGLERSLELISEFQKLGLEVVISDNYWQTNQLTFLAQENPVFVFETPIALTDPLGIGRVRRATRAGFLFMKAPERHEVLAYGKRWELVRHSQPSTGWIWAEGRLAP